MANGSRMSRVAYLAKVISTIEGKRFGNVSPRPFRKLE